MDAHPYEEIALGIKVRHLVTPLHALTVLDAGAPEREAHRLLESLDFDQAPVTGAGGAVFGFVLASDLDGASECPVSEKTRLLAPGYIVSGETPLGPALEWLAVTGVLFVIDGHSITGLVTPADMNKQAGRSYFFLLLAELELTLADFIRATFPTQSEALDSLTPERASKVRERFEDDKRRDVEADLVACLTFADVCTITERNDDLRTALGCDTKTQMEKRLGPIKQLRDDVMHPVRALLLPGRPIDQLATLATSLCTLVGRATLREATSKSG